MLSEVKQRLEGPKFNIDFGGKGLGRQGKEIIISTMQSKPILRKCVNTFVPHCRQSKHVLELLAREMESTFSSYKR